MLNSLKVLFRNSAIKISNKYFQLKKNPAEGKKLLILRMDAIGDYILFRNFIESIKKSDKYKEYSITLAGNEIWKNLAETFDKEFTDKFIWINKTRIKQKAEWRYRLKILKEIRKQRFELLIIPNDTSSKLVKDIKKHSGIRNVIEQKSDSVYLFEDIKTALRGDYYGKDHREYLMTFFQFYRNKRYIEKVLNEKLSISKPYFKLKREKQKRDYVVIFPGAGFKARAWDAKNFGKVCMKISEITDLDIIVCGNNYDRIAAKIIIEESGNSNIKDMTGKTSLAELINLIANAKLLISNETCAVHIAVSTDTNAICISNGNHIGRFNPYPAEISDLAETIYPAEVTEKFSRFPELINEYHLLSHVNINSIDPEDVMAKAEKYLIKNSKKKYSDEKL